MYHSGYSGRYTLGIDSQKKVLPIIKDFFKRDIQPTEDKYNPFDFKDETYNYELKTRTNSLKQYPTTMTTKNKCVPNTIMLFQFTDGLYYIEYDEEKFKKYDTQNYTRYEYKNPREHIYIPIGDLLPVC
jgi:hypothetical protein